VILMSEQTSKSRKIIESLAGKAIIIGVYLALLALFLYFPRLLDWMGRSKNTLHVYSFTEIISPEAIEEFEKQTGISVVMTYFETNEDLYTKFKVTGGEGYDLITPSDYMVELLAHEKLLHKLDHEQLTCFKEIDPRLMGRYFDPHNNYSIPAVWNVYGIAFDRSFLDVRNNEVSLDVIFEGAQAWKLGAQTRKGTRICMVEDPLEALMYAGLYLFGKVDNFSDQEFEAIKRLLIKQKEWIECYSNSSLYYYLLGKIVPLALTPGIFMRKLASEFTNFAFMIPKEGSMLVVENFAIPAQTKKIDMVYKFINFLLTKEMAARHSEMYGFNPTNRLAYELLDPEIANNPHYFPTDERFKKLFHTHNNLPWDKVEEVWLAVKFA
jgi:spermidine/putrescine transport system substrate-binding protein